MAEGPRLIERHLLLQWYELAMKYMKANEGKKGEIHSAPMSGAVAAYIHLSYNQKFDASE